VSRSFPRRRTEALRTLHALRLTVYNLVDVVTDMTSIARLEHVTALLAFHTCILSKNATVCNSHEGIKTVCY
jgi:hypothetical protein